MQAKTPHKSHSFSQNLGRNTQGGNKKFCSQTLHVLAQIQDLDQV